MAEDTSDCRDAAPLIHQEHVDSPEGREVNNRWNLREDEVCIPMELADERLLTNGPIS
jgi:hypothetical protein